ncbi:hypothetical protein TIFTF001_020412 [Ficus carica]|uniref:Uncharacterized protein n=1 Tax=Ficus carica TaxID=3494 RepID=A0AA88ARJ8_FICCA|nr:hypothetical protein TIFTF001_020412 [Ficus carica]
MSHPTCSCLCYRVLTFHFNLWFAVWRFLPRDLGSEDRQRGHGRSDPATLSRTESSDRRTDHGRSGTAGYSFPDLSSLAESPQVVESSPLSGKISLLVLANLDHW